MCIRDRFGTGNATQVNTITTAIDSALYNYDIISKESASTFNLIIGIVLAALIALILLGGIKRIGPVSYTHLDVYKRQIQEEN